MRNIRQSSTALEQGKLFTRFLDTVGDGTGLINGNSEYMVDLGNATFDFADGGVDDEWTLAAHGLTDGEMVYFDAIGTGCTDVFAADTNYFVIREDADTFQLAATFQDADDGVQIEGAADSIGNWSLTKQIGWFKIDPAADEVLVVTDLTFYLYDTKGGLPDEYGDLGSALTYGIGLDLLDVDGNSVIDFFGGELVKMGAEFGRFCDAPLLVPGTTNQAYVYTINFPERYGQELRLTGAAGERNSYLQVTLMDDLTGLLAHNFVAQGYYESGEALR